MKYAQTIAPIPILEIHPVKDQITVVSFWAPVMESKDASCAPSSSRKIGPFRSLEGLLPIVADNDYSKRRVHESGLSR